MFYENGINFGTDQIGVSSDEVCISSLKFPYKYQNEIPENIQIIENKLMNRMEKKEYPHYNGNRVVYRDNNSDLYRNGNLGHSKYSLQEGIRENNKREYIQNIEDYKNKDLHYNKDIKQYPSIIRQISKLPDIEHFDSSKKECFCVNCCKKNIDDMKNNIKNLESNLEDIKNNIKNLYELILFFVIIIFMVLTFPHLIMNIRELIKSILFKDLSNSEKINLVEDT